jgi:hypothetical protein
LRKYKKTGAIKCGLDSNGNKTRDGLRWRSPAVTINYRPVLSSERETSNRLKIIKERRGERRTDICQTGCSSKKDNLLVMMMMTMI